VANTTVFRWNAPGIRFLERQRRAEPGRRHVHLLAGTVAATQTGQRARPSIRECRWSTTPSAGATLNLGRHHAQASAARSISPIPRGPSRHVDQHQRNPRRLGHYNNGTTWGGRARPPEPPRPSVAWRPTPATPGPRGQRRRDDRQARSGRLDGQQPVLQQPGAPTPSPSPASTHSRPAASW